MNKVHYTVEKYDRTHYSLWNRFIATAKNATFLFHRDFMEYHKDRFQDFSLLIFKNNTLISVLPANIQRNTLHSHQGLTYGGFVFNDHIRFNDSLEIIKHSLEYCCTQHIKKLCLNPLPKIYHSAPADEIDYILFLLEATLLQRKLSSAVLPHKSRFSRDRLQGVRRGKRNQLIIKEETDLTSFWKDVLTPHFQNKFQEKPVHHLQEIQYLKEKFPKNIRQFNIYKENTIVAGTTIFETQHVAHTQYIASNSDKNTLGSLDLLHHHLITEVFASKAYFDFGTSNDGYRINEGLLYWKQGYGGGAVTHDFYEIDTENYAKLNTVFI